MADLKKQKVLIADDSEMNRELLIEMLGDEFEILLAENGAEAVDIMFKQASEISLLLLDIMMPVMDGFEVLVRMNNYNWIEDIPVIIISAENSPAYIQRAYDFGVTDFISRPFDAAVVRRRVENTLLLSAKQKRLSNLITEQIYEKEQANKLMIAILSHIVEFRNNESGMHVVHINAITDLLLRKIAEKDSSYGLDSESISMIAKASSLHDIGKISIPEEILNKPGRLTDEEFAVIKKHPLIGAEMLDALPKEQREDPLVHAAYEICRWHHERYDGRGYPDGLKGDEIPISAQVVALADVYDALTSKRCYKDAFSHETAIQMILDGQCGAFNPLLMECLKECANQLKLELEEQGSVYRDEKDIRMVSDKLAEKGLSSSQRMIRGLEFDHQCNQFFRATTDDMIFTYSFSPPMLNLSKPLADVIGIEQVIADYSEDAEFVEKVGAEAIGMFEKVIRTAERDKPESIQKIKFPAAGDREFECEMRVIWTSDEDGPDGIVGKVK